MADYTKTITNRINIFGNEVSTKWGDNNGTPYTMVWGTAKWGEGFSLIIDVEKLLTNSITFDSTVYKENEKVISNSIIISEDMYSEKLSQGDWNYIFPPNTTEGENRITTSWSSSSQSTTSYVCATAGATVWN